LYNLNLKKMKMSRIFLSLMAFLFAIVGAFASRSAAFTLKGLDGATCTNATNLVGGATCAIQNQPVFCTVTITTAGGTSVSGVDAYDTSCGATRAIKKP
jgi:hypothetical protein